MSSKHSALAISLVLGSGFVGSLALAAPAAADERSTPTTVYTETNEASGNRVLAYRADRSGALVAIGDVATGGLGSGDGLGSQAAVALSDDERFLFAVNAGSDSVTGFALERDGELRSLGTVPSGGDRPVSVTAHEGVAYVVNANSLDISGFTYSRRGLVPLDGSTQPLSPAAGGPAQVAFTPNGRQLLVTEKASNSLDVFRVRADGRTGSATSSPSSGQTPFGFDFTRKGIAVVSEAGTTSAATFDVRRDGSATAIADTSNGGQAAPCWLVVTDRGIAFTANAGATANSISSFRVDRDGQLSLLASRATATAVHPTDMALADRDSKLFNLSDQSGQIQVSSVDRGGSLDATTSVASGLPTTIVGLAATNR